MTDFQSQNHLIEGIEEHEYARLDSLPYIDPYSESDQMRAIALIEEELSKGEIKEAEEVVVNFNSHILNEEFKKIESSNGIYTLDAIDLERYKPNQPKTNRLKEWEEAVRNAKLQFEHLQIRLENLELSNAYGENAWIKYNEYLESVKKSLDESLKSTKKEINQVNLERKKAQELAKKKILLAEEYLPPK